MKFPVLLDCRITILKYFNYDETQGKLYWKEAPRCNCQLLNTEVGCDNGRGYLTVKMGGKQYSIHRLIWIIHNGLIPEGLMIDHINGIKNDNRIANLRLVSARGNHFNLQRHREGRLVGARYLKSRKKWAAQISISKKKIFLGHFNTEIEAHEAYMRALSLGNE